MYLFDTFIMDTPYACVFDTAPPIFSGITSALQRPNGSLRAGWPSATDSNPPIRYRVYIAAGSVSAAALFQTSNRVATIEPSGAGPFSFDVYSLADQTTYLGINQLYTLGVRAVDALGNEEFNTAIQTATSLGVLPDALTATAASLAATQLALDQNVIDLEAVETELEQDHLNLETAIDEFEQALETLSASNIENQVNTLKTISDNILSSMACGVKADAEMQMSVEAEVIALEEFSCQ